MRVAPIGHLGPDEYGQYIKDVLQREGVHEVRPLIGLEHLDDSLKQTLLCFVLVAPDSAHSFCSRYDFGPWPLLPGVTTMPPPAWQALQDTRAVYLNGCLFDELPSDMVLSVLLQAKNNGAVICFDPGPRSWVLSSGSRRQTLDALLDLSDIVVMTEEEALAVTGQAGAQAAAQWVLNRPESSTQWSIVKQGSSGSVLCSRQPPAVYNQSALQVPVGDTVGCGDSFAAAIVLGYIRGYDIPATMALANAVGAATAMGTGAGEMYPSANTIMQAACSWTQLQVIMDPYQSQARAHEQGPAEHGPSGQPPQAFTALQRYDAADGRGEQHVRHRTANRCYRLLEVDLAAALLHLVPYLQQQQAAAVALPTPKAAAVSNPTAEGHPHQQGQFNLQATQYQPPPQYHQPPYYQHNIIPPPVHSLSLNPDPHGTGSGPQNQYQPHPHANSIPQPVHTQLAHPMPQSYRMVQQGSHSHPQAQPRSPHGAQHQFQVLPNLSSESLRGPSLQQPQGLTAEHSSALALPPGDHPLQATPAKQQAHPPEASQIPRYDEAVLTTPAHSQDGVPMHQPYGAGPSQPQGPVGHFCQQPQAQHQVSEGTRHRSPSLEPIPLLYTLPPHSIAPEGSNVLQPASVPPRIAQYHHQPYAQPNPPSQTPQAPNQNQQHYPPSSYHTPAPHPPQGSHPQSYPQLAQPPQQLTSSLQYMLTAQQPPQHGVQYYQQQLQLQHQQQQPHSVLHEQGTASSASQGSRAVAGVQGHPGYAPGLMIADYGGGHSAGASDEALGKKRKKEKARLPTAYNIFVREEITRLKAQNPAMSHKEAFGIAADHWQYSPNNSGLAKKRRVKAAAAEATTAAPSPTAHLNPSSLILGALAPRHQGQWTCPQLSSIGAFSHSPMWVSNPQQREEGLHPPLLGHCRGHMDWTIQSRGRGVLQQPWQCRAKSNLSREDSVRSARLSLWGWTAGQRSM
ncbi:hypothetical protein WJX82_008274 [Trebouxia sp. C0006]